MAYDRGQLEGVSWQAGGESSSAEASVLIARVRWLIGLRWLYAAVMAALAALAWSGRFGGLRGLPDGAGLLALTGLTAGLNVAALACLSRLGKRPPSAELRRRIFSLTGVLIATDLVILTGMLLFSGGAHNPLLGLLVFHVAVAASLLPVRQAYLQAVLAGGLFALLAVLGEVSLWAAAMSAVLFVVFLLTVYFTVAILGRLRNINRRLVEANRNLSALDLTKSRFLRISSHQLRGPLAAIHAMLSALEAAGPMNDRQADLAGRIRQRAGEIMQELDEMMLLSTIQESAAETADRRHVEVCRILADVAGRFAEEARQRGLKLTVCADGQQFVPAWEDAIDTVCLHLLGNAVKYTPSGGQVTAVAARRDGKVLLEITDTGIGIPDDQKGRIFSEFFRATNARQVAGGTGLGLSIVKAIVERLRGRIDFQTAQGVGTKVTVTLPPGEAPAPIPGG